MNITAENKKQIIIILMAVGLGFVAVFLIAQVMNKGFDDRINELAGQYQKKQAKQAQEMEALRQHIGRMKKEQKAFEKKQQALIQKQLSNVRLPSSSLQPSGRQASVVKMESFSLKTPPGKRAITILIDSLSAVGGLIGAGDYVDIISHLGLPRSEKDYSEKQKAITVLFQNIQVLAVGTDFREVGEIPAYQTQQQARKLNVTLAVSPEEATLLTFAQEKGKLQLILRNPGEDRTLKLKVASWEELTDFVFEKQGTKIDVHSEKKKEKKRKQERMRSEVSPYIEVYKEGRESSIKK